MTKKSDAPAIRFKGFTDAWEQRKLGDIGETYTGLSGKTKADFGHGQARFVTYMNVFSNPISNPEMTEPIEIDPKQNEVEVGDVFFTTSSETPEEVGMSSVLLEKRGKTYLNSFCFGFRPSEKIDSYYLAYMLRSESARDKIILLAQGISRYNISKNKVMEIAVSLPSLDEQKLIGQYFRQLDNLITLHQRKFEKLTNVKKSMLEKMFPQNGSSYPEIRFKGFTDPWEQRKFGEITSKYEDPVLTPHDGYYRLGIRSHAKGTFHSYVAKGQELETAQMHRVAAGNFIVNITFGWEHAVAITDKNDAGKLVSHRFPQFSFAEGMVPEFFRYVIVDEKFRHHLWLASPGGAGRNRVLKLDEMLNYLMRFPSRDEQIKIAEFFRHLDNLITLHQRELEKLQNIKKSMLEKMFV
jgi:type I restriction enzyme S subunit